MSLPEADSSPATAVGGHRLSLVSVVIPSRNAAATVEATLEALSRQTYAGPWELVVADNGSSDDTRCRVAAWTGRLPQLRLVEARERQGTSYARNTGARACRGEILLFCDADDIADPNWIARMVAALQRHDCVGGRTERRRLNDEVALAARPVKAKDGLLDSFAFMPYAQMANCGMWREVWERHGGFDEVYRYGGDDAEFFWRVQLAGGTVGFAPDAVIHYRLRSGLRAIWRQWYGYGISHPHLFAAFRARGMPRAPLVEALREWLWLLIHAADLLGTRPARAVWLKRSGLRWGRLVGSWRHGVVYL